MGIFTTSHRDREFLAAKYLAEGEELESNVLQLPKYTPVGARRMDGKMPSTLLWSNQFVDALPQIMIQKSNDGRI
jgi:hypothetical protein